MIQLIFSYIKHYWNRQTAKSKVFIIFLMLALFYGSYVTIQKTYYKYKYFKQLEIQVTVLKDSIETYEIKIANLLTKGQETTLKVKKKNSQIDSKLKQDEEIINTSNVTNSELELFLSRYENR